MNDLSHTAFGALADGGTLTFNRTLPGPIDRVWKYLTDSDLRRQWLAAGDMPPQEGGEFELVWRNSELTDNPGERPDGFGDEHRMASKLTEYDPPRKLGFSWGSTGGVTFELEPAGDDVLLKLTHRRIADRAMQLNIGAGWHAHLDVLAARLAGNSLAEPFWDHWSGLKSAYEQRVTALSS